LSGSRYLVFPGCHFWILDDTRPASQEDQNLGFRISGEDTENVPTTTQQTQPATRDHSASPNMLRRFCKPRKLFSFSQCRFIFDYARFLPYPSICAFQAFFQSVLPNFFHEV